MVAGHHLIQSGDGRWVHLIHGADQLLIVVQRVLDGGSLVVGGMGESNSRVLNI